MTKPKYRIKKITPHDGVLRECHTAVLGLECEVINLFPYSPSVILVCDKVTLHTSKVKNVYGDKDITFVTRNTTYELELIE